ncbi:MAG TPA: helix-turn-helix transcriptional regulator [Solirubrobacteraceae bacterium]|jgi:transcriptional regulator with XRE-family HTH domain
MDDNATDQISAAQRALGGALRELRRRAGLTQKELGARAQASDTYLSQVETGLRDIRWSTVTRLLLALDVSLAGLAAEVERQEESIK